MGLNVGHQGESDSRRPDLSEKLRANGRHTVVCRRILLLRFSTSKLGASELSTRSHGRTDLQQGRVFPEVICRRGRWTCSSSESQPVSPCRCLYQSLPQTQAAEAASRTLGNSHRHCSIHTDTRTLRFGFLTLALY